MSVADVDAAGHGLGDEAAAAVVAEVLTSNAAAIGAEVDEAVRADLTQYLLRLGDDALILAQRTAEWTSNAPELEEDVALANIALDLLGQARMLLGRAGEVEGRGRDEDALAFLRDEREILNVQLVELDNGDFGQTIARLLLFSCYQFELYRRLVASKDPVLAAVAAKGIKEVAYHRDHAVQWSLRLGDGTEESHRRLQAGLDAVWPYVHELFQVDEADRRLVESGYAVDASSLWEPWLAAVTEVVTQATVTVPESQWRPSGGRRGMHTQGMGFLLAEMQYLHRSHPGARW